ncbi:MAG: PrsW family intramembrane metalloprotease [Halapricum sp.]
MDKRRDPVQARNEGLDLQDVVDWEQRTILDTAAVVLYRALVFATRAFVVVLALLILVTEIALGTLGTILANPTIGAMALLSAVPALGLAVYIWRADITSPEPLMLLVGTFLLGVLFAGFAGVLNTTLPGLFGTLGIDIGMVGFFYLIVGPVEEGVKLLAVRLYPFRDDRFDAVIDGAVYGAVAGLGFATIENALYISQNVAQVGHGQNLLLVGSSISAVRALAGPGHVIYSAFSGYYLGLAKFNPENAGPIVVKGLLIAALIHGTYNTLSLFAPQLLADMFGLNWVGGFLLFVIVFDTVFGFLLFQKLRAYRLAYKRVYSRPEPRSEPTEFDP